MKILGGLLLASPFIAIALLPLYTDCLWLDVGVGYGIAVGIGIVVFAGASLLYR